MESVDVVRQALTQALLFALPILGAGLCVGLLVSLFQAVTQIQEQTLTFVPKIITMILVAVVMLSWIPSASACFWKPCYTYSMIFFCSSSFSRASISGGFGFLGGRPRLFLSSTIWMPKFSIGIEKFRPELLLLPAEAPPAAETPCRPSEESLADYCF